MTPTLDFLGLIALAMLTYVAVVLAFTI